MKHLEFYQDLYGVTFYAILGMPRAEFLAYAKQHFKHKPELTASDAAYTGFWTTPEGRRRIVIWTETVDLANLAHECGHGASFVLDSVGVEPSFENDEPWTYLLEWIFRKILRGK